MTTLRIWRQVRVLGLIGALLTTAIAAVARAQEPSPTTEAGGHDVCLSDHEKSQELRLGGRLLDSKKALLSCAEEQCPSIVRADCLRWLAELEDAIPTIVVVAESDRGDEIDVKVTIDDQVVTNQLNGKAIELDPGTHHIVFERNGTAPREMRLNLGQGEKNRIIRLDFRTKPKVIIPAASTAPPALQPLEGKRPVPTLTYVFGGVALAAVISATFFGLEARSARNDAITSCAPLCPGSVIDDVKAKALYSDLSSGVALLSATTAVILYATRPTLLSDEPPNRYGGLLEHWRLGVSVNAAYTTLGGAF